MATYTGTLTDFGLDALTPYSPRLIFTANKPAFSGSNVLSTRPIEVPVDPNGNFTVDLVPSVSTTPNVRYSLRIEWLNEADRYVGMDIIDGIAPTLNGGPIAEMGGIPISEFFVSPPPGPPNPAAGMWWLDSTNGNLNEWI